MHFILGKDYVYILSILSYTNLIQYKPADSLLVSIVGSLTFLLQND